MLRASGPRMSRVDLLIVGGTVVNAYGSKRATVAISKGRIVQVADPTEPLPEHDRAIDATGRFLIPGGVDAHCHVDEQAAEYHLLDDYETASIAALWGGTTTVVGFAIPENGQTPLAAGLEAQRKASFSRCDTATHACVIDWDDTTAKQLNELSRLGIRTIKLFTTYSDDVMASSETMRNVLRFAAENGWLVYVHAEDDDVVVASHRALASSGSVGAELIPLARPEHAEAKAVERVLEIAEDEDAPVYFVHQSTPAAVQLVADARQRGVRAYNETCPHYLSLTDERYMGLSPEKWVCCPPLRSSDSVRALVEKTVSGHVDVIASDHCSFSSGQKAEHASEVNDMPKGLPGVETRLPVAYTKLVLENGMSMESFVAMFSTNPAKLNGLKRKGSIAVDADADIVILDTASGRLVLGEDLHMASDYTPFEGMRLYGWPTVVISNGQVVIDEDGFHDPGAVGIQLKADKIT